MPLHQAETLKKLPPKHKLALAKANAFVNTLANLALPGNRKHLSRIGVTATVADIGNSEIHPVADYRSRRKDLDSEAEDLALVRRLQNGDHDALTHLFEKYAAMVLGIAKRMLRNDAEAEEVVQRVFLDTYRAIQQFDEHKASYKTWLFQYAYHRTLNRKKELQRHDVYSLCDVGQSQEPPPEVFEVAGHPVRLHSQEITLLVEQLLKSIPARQREVIELTYFEGLTAEEIASKTGQTPDVVRHNLYRGLKKLRPLVHGQRDARSSALNNVEATLLEDPAPSL